jgi:serine/threonine-protein kinase
MGTVALAEDTVLGRRVALKRVRGAAGEHGLLRLRREAVVGASLSHPNLVSIFDVEISEDGEVVIVMEYVEGQTLRELIADRGRLPAEEALTILSGVAAGLDAIHGERIVHRDVKPANVLLGQDGAVKLADLGIASVADHTRITTSGSVLGSLSYMAPEQLKDSPATPAIDVYALAAVAYEALSGKKAHREANPVALAYAVSTRPPPDLRQVWEGAPPAAAELLMQAMSRDPDARPRSAGELAGRLRAAVLPEATRTSSAAPVAAVPSAEPVQRPQPAAEAPQPDPPQRPPINSPRPRAQKPEPSPQRPARAARVVPVALPPRRPASPAEREPSGAREASAPAQRHQSRRRLLVPLLAAIILAVVVAVVISSTGGSGTHHGAAVANRPSNKGAAGNSGGSRSTSSSATSSSGPGASAGTSGAGSSATPAAGTTAQPGTPAAAVQSFYTLAAAHKYPQAWALADPTFQSQLRGYQSFQSTFSGDKSITFASTRTVAKSPTSATVAIATRSVRTDGTQNCTGTVALRSVGQAQWQLHQINVTCS